MGAATFLIGLLPTYAQAGHRSAPILLILLRILQGIALGGEYGGAAIYVAEHAPNDKRGAATGWIQSSASFGLLAALLVIVATRTLDRRGCVRSPGAGASRSSSRRCCWRSRCGCAPSSPKARISPSSRRRATVAKAPLREAFGDAEEHLKRVLIAFFGIMCAQGAVWYFTFFYMQVFLERSLGLPSRDQGPAADRDDRRQRAALRLFRLAQRPHRPQAGDGRRDAARAGAVFPRLRTGSPAPPTRRWSRRSDSTPVFVETDPATCSVQFDPVGTAKFVSACDIAKSDRSSPRGISFQTRPSTRRRDRAS